MRRFGKLIQICDYERTKCRTIVCLRAKILTFTFCLKNNLKAFVWSIHRPQNFHVGIAENNTTDDFCSLDIKFKSDGDDKIRFSKFPNKNRKKTISCWSFKCQYCISRNAMCCVVLCCSKCFSGPLAPSCLTKVTPVRQADILAPEPPKCRQAKKTKLNLLFLRYISYFSTAWVTGKVFVKISSCSPPNLFKSNILRLKLHDETTLCNHWCN